MTTAVRQGDMQILGQLLEERLQLKFFLNGPLHVKCVRRQDTLMVLGQHPEVVVPDPQQVFSVLEQAIKSLLRPQNSQKVQLYLRVASKNQPYASHAFTLAPVAKQPPPPPPAPVAPESAEPVGASVGNSADLESLDRADLVRDAASGEDAPHPEVSEPPAPAEEFDPLPTLTVASETSLALRGPHSLLPALLTSAGFTLLVLVAGVYPLSRPCVLGKCGEIATAQQLGQDSEKTLQQEKTAFGPVRAQEQLARAAEILKPIPFWSFYYPQAQSLLRSYEVREKRVSAILEIQKKATAAAGRSQNPPYSVPTWLEIQSEWREAIAQLEQLPADSEVAPWRERKLKEYRANLKEINGRVNAEQLGEKKLKTAKDAAKMAEARQSVAQSLESWQVVYATWQTAVQALAQIPPRTVASEEAQRLLQDYRLKLAASRERRTTEQMGANAYNQSLRLAEDAQRAERLNQWFQAVILWRKALNYAEQVPSETDFYAQSLPLRESYSNSLQRAQSKLQVALALQKARTDLKKTCSNALKICDYTVSSDMLTVYITPEYRQAVRDTALTADKQRDYKSRLKVDDHVQRLQTALELISKKTGIPISVYDPSGSLIGSYNPRV
ncbi:hypothetical protein [Kamptonema formosum]|uniref:hypothetical protein n=1 Tax=Kamptonema formosum TaxID=331992 RepID=UPI000349273A|nr:hypothetical protein [Oscillatoria sp. PCC 10802]